MPVPVFSSTDGVRITINDFIRDPDLVPSLVLDIANEEFITDAVLRQAGPALSGVLRYNESTPIYADTATSVRTEFAEVPVATTSVGTPKVAYVEERALAIVVSDEMQRRANVDPVTRQLVQVRNTMTKSWDDTFFSTLTGAAVNTLAGADWGLDATNVFADLAEAIRLIETASVTAGGQTSPFGYEADTLIIGRGTKADLLRNKEFNTLYRGNIADENIQYRGVMPNQIAGLDVLVSRRVASGTAIVMQRNMAGFIADELPLQASAMYRDEPRKIWRSDIQRASAIGIDNPKAVTIISGIYTP
jgi:hypothetical protein